MSRTPGFRSVLVPVDGSPFAEAAIPYALEIAERADCKVRVALVHPHNYPPLLIEPSSIYMKKLICRLRGRLGRRVSSMILTGPVAPTLAKHAHEVGADLVVMTTHGCGGLRRAWLGSVTDELIRTTEIPVLVIRPPENGTLPSLDLREILVPLDGSLLSEVALQPAMAAAELWNAELSLLHVVPNAITVDAVFPYPIAPDEDLPLRMESAEAYVDQVVARSRLGGARVSGEAVVDAAGVAETLLDAVKRRGISLIAMATHGRGGVGRLVFGSVTERIVRAADVPVLVVPLSQAARRVIKAQEQMSAERDRGAVSLGNLPAFMPI